jgi:hypothetical protein
VGHWVPWQELATLFSTDKGKLREYKEQLLVAENRVRANFASSVILQSDEGYRGRG